jgi:hypothetical protein
MEHVKKIEAETSRWPNISTRSHRFGGREFLFGKAEIGHVHTGGVVDIPFPRPIRDVAPEGRPCSGASLGSRLWLDHVSRPQ